MRRGTAGLDESEGREDLPLPGIGDVDAEHLADAIRGQPDLGGSARQLPSHHNATFQ